MDDSLLESLEAGVLTLTLNRPARRNALDEALITRLHRRLAAAGEDGAVRTVVLTGAGGAFSSGADLKEAATTLTGDLIERAYNPAIRAIRRMPKPVIAAVDGVATGYGASSRSPPTFASRRSGRASRSSSHAWGSPSTAVRVGSCPGWWGSAPTSSR